MIRRELALACVMLAALGALAEPVKQGLWKKFLYDAPDTTPIVYGGESRGNA